MFKRKNKLQFDRNILVKNAIKFLQKKDYTFVKRLGSGSFGDVIAIQKKGSEVMAAKIMHKSYTAQGELYLWPCLKHPNVLPLVDRLYNKNTDIFVMPLMHDSLYDVLDDADFRNSPKLLDMTIDWMRDMISGLEYMHGYGVCHMDLKADNIMISKNLRAVISDFSGIAETKEPLNR